MAISKRKWKTSSGEEKETWQVSYTDSNKKRRRKVFSTKTSADKWLTKTKHDLEKGTHTPESTSITFGVACDNWIARANREGLEQSTIDQYETHVELHLKPMLGSAKLAKLTAPGMERIRDQLLEKHSRSMAKKVLTSLKAVLAEAHRRGDVAQNVTADVQIRTTSREKPRLRVGKDIPTRGEVQQIIAHVSPKWRPLIVTATFTGMRCSELRGLTWSSVDFENRLIHVTQRADRYAKLGKPKSESGDRRIPMSPAVLNTLLEWRERCPKSDLDLVFPTAKGKLEQHSNIHHRGIGAAQVRAGIVKDSCRKNKKGEPVMVPRYGMHSLRHWYASWILTPRDEGGLGYAIKRAQTVLGHADPSMTLRTYTHLISEDAVDEDVAAAAELAILGTRMAHATKAEATTTSNSLTNKASARSSVG